MTANIVSLILLILVLVAWYLSRPRFHVILLCILLGIALTFSQGTAYHWGNRIIKTGQAVGNWVSNRL